MTDAELIPRLEALREQGYPLTLSTNDAEALVECITRIMQAVPEDDQPFVRADYALATSAISHPPPNEFGTSNKRLRFPYRTP